MLKKLFTTTFLFYFAFNAMYAVTAVFAKDSFSWNPTNIGILLFVVGLIDIFSQGFLVRKLIPKFGEVKLWVIGLILIIAGMATAAVTSIYISTVLFYIRYVILNVGDGLLEPSYPDLSQIPSARVNKEKYRVVSKHYGDCRVLGPLFAAWLYGYFRGLPYVGEVLLIVATLFVLLSAIPSIRAHHVKDAQE